MIHLPNIIGKRIPSNLYRGVTYIVLKQLRTSQIGRYGLSFCGKESRHDKQVFIKAPNLEDQPSIEDVITRLRKISESFKHEFDNTQRLKKVKHIAHVTDYVSQFAMLNNEKA